MTDRKPKADFSHVKRPPYRVLTPEEAALGRDRAAATRAERAGELDRPATVEALLRHAKKRGFSRHLLEVEVLGDMRTGKRRKDLNWFVSANKQMTLRALLDCLPAGGPDG